MKMSPNFALVAVCAILFQTQISARAQGMFPFIFSGTSMQINGSGNLVKVTISQRTLLNDVTKAAGVDPGGLMLVYHIHGTGFGDTVDLINTSTGAVVVNLFGFYFGEDFGRQAITNSTGTIIKRLDYLYTQQNDHSLGAALVTKTLQPKISGIQTQISGTMNWVVESTASTPTKICNGSFFIGRELFFSNSH
jgi:hypothetical protein